MSITAIDRASALIAVDLQKGILGLTAVDDVARIVEHTSKLADAFHSADLPVVWVTAVQPPPGRAESPLPGGEPPAGFTDLDPRLPVFATDIFIPKRALSAFSNSGLATELARLGITQVVITGLATGMGVESAARSAYDAGFNVTIASDAVADPVPERAARSFEHVFPQIAETGTTDAVITALRSNLA